MEEFYHDFYLIIQAGGKGTRLRPLTLNRPKCLVPLEGSTILQKTIKTFDTNTFVISDYLYDVFKNFLQLNKIDNVSLINTEKKGTCSGIKECLEKIDYNIPIIIMWSDLLFENLPVFDFKKTTIGISKTFECRYQYINNEYVKKTGNESGIAGFFSFPCKSLIEDIPEDGSFVGKFLKEKFFKFENILELNDCFEIGTHDSFIEYTSKLQKSRFFNKVIIDDFKVTKSSEYKTKKELLNNEINWYKKFSTKKELYEIPNLISENPFSISRKFGYHPYEIPQEEKIKALKSIIQFINKLQKEDEIELNFNDIKEMYLDKVISRVEPYKKLIRDIDKKFIVINGIKIKNPLVDNFILCKEMFKEIKCNSFKPIHGDLTFSNCLWDIKEQSLSVFDPRAKFGQTMFYGDPAYEWSKIFYSAVDQYDVTNNNNYIVVHGEDVLIHPLSNNLLSKIFWEYCPFEKKQIFARLVTIWFSLIGYLENDIDAMNFAFYKGCIAYEKYCSV